MTSPIATSASARPRSRSRTVRDVRAEHGWSDGRHQHVVTRGTRTFLDLPAPG